MSEEKKRGRGRPAKLPPGKRSHIRCILVNGEKEKLDAAMDAADMTQVDFARASVLHCADIVLGNVPATPKPKRKK